MLDKVHTTSTGLKYVELEDSMPNNVKTVVRLQQSTGIKTKEGGSWVNTDRSAGKEYLWLGLQSNESKEYANLFAQLSREQVEALVDRLQEWIDDGDWKDRTQKEEPYEYLEVLGAEKIKDDSDPDCFFWYYRLRLSDESGEALMFEPVRRIYPPENGACLAKYEGDCNVYLLKPKKNVDFPNREVTRVKLHTDLCPKQVLAILVGLGSDTLPKGTERAIRAMLRAAGEGWK